MRIISISKHLIEKLTTNKYLNLVLNHEQPTLICSVNELPETFNIHSNDIQGNYTQLQEPDKKQSP